MLNAFEMHYVYNEHQTHKNYAYVIRKEINCYNCGYLVNSATDR